MTPAVTKMVFCYTGGELARRIRLLCCNLLPCWFYSLSSSKHLSSMNHHHSRFLSFVQLESAAATEKLDGGSNDVSIGDVSLSLKPSLSLSRIPPLALLRDDSHQFGTVASLSIFFTFPL
ncbi:hypothetical protein PIB30_035650 [Stylosanthes scabra]|uniref:Uncharacterized protein n=1 Tax=Stylosanthes scabra TaxID=79078 RepID=A0ABU6QDI0_9FABA|nr:hypothetical protein [Stylosanthes scabra]